LSAGLDFESRLFYKPDAVERLREELSSTRDQCQPLVLGINTDAYQPVERKVGLTRRILELLAEVRHPVILVTKSSLIERDIDLLAPMAATQLVSVSISISTLSRNLSRRLEPRAASPERRLETLRRIADAGIPLTLLMAPVIPVITDSEMETILQTGREAGAVSRQRGLCVVAVAARSQRSVHRVVGRARTVEGVVCHVEDTRNARRQGIRFALR
jgi:DNA repair photolyase